MACTQKQLKDFPWTIGRAAALFREARTEYVEKGITDFNKIVDGLSASHNLKREIIIKGLDSPKGVPRNLTDDMWVKQQAARKLSSAARVAIQQMGASDVVKGLNYVANAPRRVLLAGHFGAFTKSHLADQLFYAPDTYARNFKDSWALATKRGMALHEQRVRTELNPTDPEVKLALRAGLNVGESGAGYFAKETSEVTGGIKKFFKGPDRASMAYDELRVSRMGMFRKELARLSPEERRNLDQVKALADVLNHDSGTTARSNRLMRFMFLSPRLLPAQLTHTFYDVPRSLVKTGMGFKYSSADPAMRYVARKTAILASAYTGMLAINYGIGKGVGAVTGDEELAKKFTPNLGQEGLAATSLLRPKLFGYSIPISPTVELMKLPVQMIAAGAAARKGDNKTLVALTRGLRTIIGRQNPLWDLVQEALFGQDPGTGRPTPFPGVTGKTEPTASKPTMSTTEYLGTKLPIPAANYVQEFHDELISHGMPPENAAAWARLIAIPTFELGTSYHLSEDKEPPAKAGRRRMTPIGAVRSGAKPVLGN
jgi:hypothetical protein